MLAIGLTCFPLLRLGHISRPELDVKHRGNSGADQADLNVAVGQRLRASVAAWPTFSDNVSPSERLVGGCVFSIFFVVRGLWTLYFSLLAAVASACKH